MYDPISNVIGTNLEKKYIYSISAVDAHPVICTCSIYVALYGDICCRHMYVNNMVNKCCIFLYFFTFHMY